MMKQVQRQAAFEKRRIYLTSNSQGLRGFIDKRKNFYFIKRSIDITLSFLIIVFVLSWMIPLIAFLIWMDSGGPVFFIQKRVGRGGRTFNCLKFRTMIPNNEANKCQATDDDQRITRIGRFLRKSNLDEFPQFLNVLSGEMSIVGPRPHMHADCNKFANAIPGYKFRNLVKPGITGLAQIKGYRGPTRDFESMFRRYQYDSFYIRNAGIGLDLRIVRHTAGQTVSIIWNKVIRREASQQEAPQQDVHLLSGDMNKN